MPAFTFVGLFCNNNNILYTVFSLVIVVPILLKLRTYGRVILKVAGSQPQYVNGKSLCASHTLQVPHFSTKI